MKIKFLLNKFSSKGFTLIELLIVIAILGVLAAGVLVAIDPVDKIAQANDAKVQNDISAIGRASEAYATTHAGVYPATIQVLVDTGELKRPPASPNGIAYTMNANGVCGTMTSKRWTNPNTAKWGYTFSTGTSAAAAACP